MRYMTVLLIACLVLGPAACVGPERAGAGRGQSVAGVRLETTGVPRFTDRDGRPFTARGVVYFQPEAAHHYFLERLDTARVAADLVRYRDAGFNTIGVVVNWGEIVAETEPGNGHAPLRFHEDRVARLRSLMRQAADSGFFVQLNPATQIVPPQVPAKEYPGATDDAGNHHPAFRGYLLPDWRFDPAVNRGWLSFLTALGRCAAPFDNILCYALPFEVMNQQFPWCRQDPQLLEAWHAWLRDTNPDAGYWRARWGLADETWASVADIPAPMHAWAAWDSYYAALGMDPGESPAAMWRDWYDFEVRAVAAEGRFGMSMLDMRSAIRAGDHDALILYKPLDPWRYAWEMGALEAFRAGEPPAQVAEVLDDIFNCPGVDIIACDGYPIWSADPEQQAAALGFDRQREIAESFRQVSRLPLYCQEFGMSHAQWSQTQRTTFISNGIRAWQQLGLLGYSVWQSDDFHGGGTWDAEQPRFGLYDLSGRPYPVVDAVRRLQTGKE